MTVVYISLGSNLGDKISYIQQAVKLLNDNENFKLIRTSTFYETEPWGNKNQDWFLNVVIEAKTNLLPLELLELSQSVEFQLGRDRENVPKWGERTIDIDIIFYGSEIINTKNLVIPHKYMHERAFVLVPMLELTSSFVHPVFNKTILELHDELENPEDVFLYGTIS